MNAAEIKSLGKVWGSQHGLLSVAELALLMRLVRDYPGQNPRVLEVGHYLGLSTCGLVHALRVRGDADWSLTTLDSHEEDQWVPATHPHSFYRNRRAYFDDYRLEVVISASQTLTEPLPYDVVFYDGDHGDEQLRFTRLVMASPNVRLLVFDDRDFDVPMTCCAELVAAGWRDESPPLNRMPQDKRDPKTMTLGVMRTG